MKGAGQRGGRPRSPETDRLIREAALPLLRTQGPTAVNIDAVAARFGVARTTIYRRYRSRDDLVGAILEALVATPVPAPTLPVREKVRWVLENILRVLEDGIGRGGTAAVLNDIDPSVTTALRERLTDRLRVLIQAMVTDVEAGRLSHRVDPETLVGFLFGAYLSEILLHGAPRTGWVHRTVDFLAPALTPAAGGD